MDYKLTYTGKQVQALLDKINALIPPAANDGGIAAEALRTITINGITYSVEGGGGSVNLEINTSQTTGSEETLTNILYNGVKYIVPTSEGGATVVANPSGDSVGILTSISINGVKYETPHLDFAGKSEGFVYYEPSTNATDTFRVGNGLTLSEGTLSVIAFNPTTDIEVV